MIWLTKFRLAEVCLHYFILAFMPETMDSFAPNANMTHCFKFNFYIIFYLGVNYYCFIPVAHNSICNRESWLG